MTTAPIPDPTEPPTDPWWADDDPPPPGCHVFDQDYGTCDRCGTHVLDAAPMCDSRLVTLAEAMGDLLAKAAQAPLPDRLQHTPKPKRTPKAKRRPRRRIA